MRVRGTCQMNDCGKPNKAFGYCDKHYQRLKNHGDVTKGEYRPTFEERLILGFEEIEQFECWKWIKGVTSGGYGSIKNGRKNPNAHREMYKLFAGEIPDGLVLDHWKYPGNCIGRSCVNPEHLRPTTLGENSKRSVLFVLNQCKRGHDMTDENTYHSPRGRRLCRICHRLRAKLWKQRHP